ncbi:uncharacterized protein B0H18DRAFT_1126121 [Fomitopsis serialis]|uniref:uncharacterized protein n=1 Tax=Fomitopsis serialis TaxID=139415 RepID=UPI002007D02F|nr:uncharacterized protein B0H18DRAFT_1126121 [Neoantrodia serialis]KAH9913587.1 hypothetical protein B0H18DRAFT_1126121 [Neoantrodia serialis]
MSTYTATDFDPPVDSGIQELQEEKDGAVCAYCGSTGTLLECCRCHATLCYGTQTDCIQDGSNLIDSESFVCPVCRHRAREPLDYRLTAYVVPGTYFAAQLAPLCLITAHFDREMYFGSLARTQLRQDYGQIPLLLHDYSVRLTAEGLGWSLTNSTALASAWLASNRASAPMVLVSLETHTDPATGYVAYGRTGRGQNYVASVPEVVSKVLGPMYNQLPLLTATRGLVLFSCGDAVTVPERMHEIENLVQRMVQQTL